MKLIFKAFPSATAVLIIVLIIINNINFFKSKNNKSLNIQADDIIPQAPSFLNARKTLVKTKGLETDRVDKQENSEDFKEANANISACASMDSSSNIIQCINNNHNENDYEKGDKNNLFQSNPSVDKFLRINETKRKRIQDLNIINNFSPHTNITIKLPEDKVFTKSLLNSSKTCYNISDSDFFDKKQDKQYKQDLQNEGLNCISTSNDQNIFNRNNKIKLSFWTKLKNKVSDMKNSIKYNSFRVNEFLDFSKKCQLKIFNRHFNNMKVEIKQIMIELENIMYFSYRSFFEPFVNSENKIITSDCGWGCMIRCGQMILYHGFLRIFLQSLKNFAPMDEENMRTLKNLLKLDLLMLFLDNPLASFEIQNTYDFPILKRSFSNFFYSVKNLQLQSQKWSANHDRNINNCNNPGGYDGINDCDNTIDPTDDIDENKKTNKIQSKWSNSTYRNKTLYNYEKFLDKFPYYKSFSDNLSSLSPLFSLFNICNVSRVINSIEENKLNNRNETIKKNTDGINYDNLNNSNHKTLKNTIQVMQDAGKNFSDINIINIFEYMINSRKLGLFVDAIKLFYFDSGSFILSCFSEYYHFNFQNFFTLKQENFSHNNHDEKDFKKINHSLFSNTESALAENLLTNFTKEELSYFSLILGLNELNELNQGINARTLSQFKGLVFISFRLGLKKISDLYQEAIYKVFDISNNLGLLGGINNSAYYFIGYCENKNLVFLDPHLNQKSVKSIKDLFENNSRMTYYNLDQIYQISIKGLSPGFTIGFYYADFISLINLIEEIKTYSSLNYACFQYFEQQKEKGIYTLKLFYLLV